VARRVKQPDVVSTLAVMILSVVIGLLVASVLRGDGEQVMNVVMIVVGITLAIGVLRDRHDRRSGSLAGRRANGVRRPTSEDRNLRHLPVGPAAD